MGTKTKPSLGRYTKDKSFKPKVPCQCKCPSCGLRFIEESNKLYSDRLNYVYCLKDRSNRVRNPHGFKLEDCRGAYSKENMREIKKAVEEDQEELIHAQMNAV